MSENSLQLSAQRLKQLWHDSELTSKEIAAKLSQEIGRKVSITTLRNAYAMLSQAAGKDYSLNKRPKGTSGPRINLEITGLDSVTESTQSEAGAPMRFEN